MVDMWGLCQMKDRHRVGFTTYRRYSVCWSITDETFYEAFMKHLSRKERYIDRSNIIASIINCS